MHNPIYVWKFLSKTAQGSIQSPQGVMGTYISTISPFLIYLIPDPLSSKQVQWRKTRWCRTENSPKCQLYITSSPSISSQVSDFHYRFVLLLQLVCTYLLQILEYPQKFHLVSCFSRIGYALVMSVSHQFDIRLSLGIWTKMSHESEMTIIIIHN